MGGSLIHIEPIKLLLLEAYDHIGNIIHQARWMKYVQHLQQYDDKVALKFTLYFGVEQSIVAGTLVEVT